MGAIETEVERQFQRIAGRADEIIPEAELKEKLKRSLESGRPLRVKYGIDPTIPHIHIGHLVPCRLIRGFQDLGHTAVLVIGDYTARIGDPTGRNAARPALSQDEVAENMHTYSDQLFRVVDPSAAEVVYQSSWFGDLPLSKTMRLLSQFSVAQIMAHETFRTRMDAGFRLSLHEIMYPVLQAYDSVMIDADVEIGGTDQRFNCLCGRDLQRDTGREPQVVVTVPLLIGSDGQKMSKSLNNHISVESTADQIVGRVMSIPDSLIEQYARLATDWTDARREAFVQELRAGCLHPMQAKLQVARSIAAQLRGEEASREAVAEFERVFSRRERPSAVERVELASGEYGLIALLSDLGLTTSRSEARRLVEQGGVRINEEAVADVRATIYVKRDERTLIRAGKRAFVEVIGS